MTTAATALRIGVALCVLLVGVVERGRVALFAVLAVDPATAAGLTGSDVEVDTS